MKTFPLFLALFFSISVFASTADTTLNYDINSDGKEETIKLQHKDDDQSFVFSINDVKLNGKFDYAYGSSIQIIDMDEHDGVMEVIVIGYGNSDQNDMFFYQFVDGKIIEVAHLPSNFGVETDNHGTLTEHAWMGFWTMQQKYRFDSKAKTLTKVDEEFYNVDQQCEVTKPFKLLSKREDDAAAVVELKPKTKITLVKADLTPKCLYDNGDTDDFFCDWYFIRTADGKEGWVRLKMFYENVDGLIWAG